MNCPHCGAENPEGLTYCIQCTTRLPTSDETLSIHPKIKEGRDTYFTIGTVVAKRYKLIEKLGGGGMGVVFKAEDLKLKRHVALKFLPPSLTQDAEHKMRFMQEAHAASILEHPNICTIHEIDETKDGQMYIAMAYYPGETLKKKIQRGPLPFDLALDIVIQIAQGLHKAHSNGIIHRDIKASNVMVTSEGIMKIVDFGLAKLSSQPHLTETTQRVGTPCYMSPEQARGEDVDSRTDIWSLGVVFYELLTGKLPFGGKYEQAVIQAIINKSAVPPSELREDIPEDAERIILKCLRKEKNERYPSAEKLALDLSQLKKALELEKYKVIIDKKERPEIKKETEWRQATVMFVEVSGYGEMLEVLDPEEAASVTGRIFALFGSIFEKYGAKIEHISGGNILVLFGIPKTIEDGPRKAINAALELRESISQVNREESLRVPLDVHIGINTGMVIAGGMDADRKRDFSVLGDTVTLASHLKDLTAKGQVYIGPTTYRFTKDDFEYEKLKPVTIRALKEPMPAFKLVSVHKKIHRPRPGAGRMITSVMVGRDYEFDKLQLHVLNVINGRGSLVNIVGEAGIGKSRLIAELEEKEEVKRVAYIKGRALSIGRNLSFHPIIDALKNWAKVKEDDTPAASSQKLEHAIRNIYPEEASEVYPFIATLMGLRLYGFYEERIRRIEGEALEKLILKNLRELIIKASKVRPVVFVLDDLHWADMTTLKFMESLFRLAESNSILFINIFRPNYPETGERIARTAKERYGAFSSEIILEPLAREHCETLIENLLNIKGLPVSLREHIIRKTEGNPFFIEEVVRSFIDEGAVVAKEDGFRVTDKIDMVVIPETIQEILMARIDRLDEETRALLKVASVIGRNFFYRILAEVAKSIGSINDKIEYLKNVQLIVERRRLEELEYLFKHALVQEVTYESILLKKRKELHVRVAKAFEAVFPERLSEFYGMLAYHYSYGENLEKAEEYLVKAGEEALKAAASTEALHYYQEALKLYLKKHGDAGDPQAIAHMELNIAKAFLNKGHMEEAVQHFDRVLEIWGEKRPKSKIISLAYFLLNLLRVLRSIYLPTQKVTQVPPRKLNDMFEVIYHRGTALVSTDTRRMVTDSIRFLGTIRKYDLDKVSNGIQMYASSSALFFFPGISFGIARKLLDYASGYINPEDRKTFFQYKFWELAMNTLAGKWQEDIPYEQSVIDRNIKDGDMYTPPGFVYYAGVTVTEQGKFGRSEMFLNKLTEIGEMYENDYVRSRKHALSAHLSLKKRMLSEAIREADERVDWLKQIGQKFWAAYITGIKIQAHLLLGDLSGAENALKQGEIITAQEKHIAPFYICMLRLGEFLYDLCRLEEGSQANDGARVARYRRKAGQSGKAVIKNAKKCALGRTEALRMMGNYCWLTGKQKKAFAWWERSIKAGLTLGAAPELARTYFEVGKRLLASDRKQQKFLGQSAGEYLQKARLMFEELGLQWDMEQLSRVA